MDLWIRPAYLRRVGHRAVETVDTAGQAVSLDLFSSAHRCFSIVPHVHSIYNTVALREVQNSYSSKGFWRVSRFSLVQVHAGTLGVQLLVSLPPLNANMLEVPR